MGTQQILLIVLSVIIVGIAVAVGITMFNAQATNSNRSAIVGDMNNLASSALAFYKTPASHGGGAQSWGSDIDEVGMWLGYGYDATADSLGTGNGGYFISVSSDDVTIIGVGTSSGNDTSFNNEGVETGNVQATMVIDGSAETFTMTLNN